MKTYLSLPEFRQVQKPIVLTIGNYDGVHRGHQAVLARVVDKAKELGGTTAVLTYSNHPATILNPSAVPRLLCTPAHREELFAKAGIEIAIFLTFTLEFSQQSAADFLESLRECLPFRNLVLGYDATIGRKKEGNKEKVLELSRMMGFAIEYVPPIQEGGIVVSSSLIRQSIAEGDLQRAQLLLGRPYSILTTVASEVRTETQRDATTINLDVRGLCLPPVGAYTVEIKFSKRQVMGVVHVKPMDILTCDISAWKSTDNLTGQAIEIVFR